MRTNVFLRSTLRRPILVVFLLLIMGLVDFAFTARVGEYLLVGQETNRLEGYYRSIGQLTATGADSYRPADEAMAFLENNPYVDFVDRRRFPSAVMQDIYNGDFDGIVASANNTKHADIFFIGVLIDANGTYQGEPVCRFRIEDVLTGYPEYIEAERLVNIVLSSEENPDIVKSLEPGECYLVHGHFDYTKDSGVRYGQMPQRFFGILESEDIPVFYHIQSNQDLDWTSSSLSSIAEEIQQVHDNQCALQVITSKDMTAMPWTQSDSLLYLTEGRWLDGTDQATGKRACVINDALAELRGLEIGDSITVMFRNVWNHNGYIVYSEENHSDFDTQMESYEIVGTYDFVQNDFRDVTFYRNWAFFPDSAVPEIFDPLKDEINASSFSFVLSSPEDEEQFLLDTREALAEMGFRAEFLESGWSDFQSAVRPMLRSSLYNLLAFTIILLMSVCIVVLFYLKLRKRDIAIARALGVPVSTCAWQATLPLVLISILAALCGGIPGWRYVLDNGGTLLASLDSYYPGSLEIHLPAYWLPLICSGEFLLTLLVLSGGIVWLMHHSTLELLQGGVQAKEKTITEIDQRDEPKSIAPETAADGVNAGHAAQTYRRDPSIFHMLRFVGRYIIRSKVKTLLTILLAAFFTVGLAAIQVSISRNTLRINELYKTVLVKLELVQRDSTTYVSNGGFIPQATVNSILSTEFVSDCYLEGEYLACDVTRADFIPSFDDETSDSAKNPGSNYSLRSFDNMEAFLSNSGAGIDITYHTGWDKSMFAKDWVAENELRIRSGGVILPAILPQSLYDACQISEGDRIYVTVLSKGKYVMRLFEVAGMYTGLVAGSDTAPVLLPAGAMSVLLDNAPLYRIAQFTIDPEKNWKLSEFRADLDEIIDSSNRANIPLRALLWDEELHRVVEPLENSVRFMAALYPVTLALSLLAAAGVSILLIFSEVREAAIMRALGTSKLRSRMMLSLQVLFAVLIGLSVGLGFILGYGALTSEMLGISAICAALYLLSAAFSLAIGSVIVTNRSPLSLLQERE